eukprot:8664803-Prorocentrum_lima.AAC.1
MIGCPKDWFGTAISVGVPVEARECRLLHVGVIPREALHDALAEGVDPLDTSHAREVQDTSPPRRRGPPGSWPSGSAGSPRRTSRSGPHAAFRFPCGKLS